MLIILDVLTPLHLVCITFFILSSPLFLTVLLKSAFSTISYNSISIINNIILLFALVSLFVSLLEPFLRSFEAIDSIASSGTKDPRVISAGFLEFIASYLIYLLLTTVQLLEHVVIKFVIMLRKQK